MALAPIPIVTRGDYVLCENKMFYVETVDNSLGFNIYTRVEFVSGRKITRARHEFEKTAGSLMADEVTEGMNEGKTEEMEKKETTCKKRFDNVTEKDVETLQLHSNSKGTREQTAWGVSIFKGETLAINVSLNKPPLKKH